MLTTGKAQALEGRWEGYYADVVGRTSISLEFILTKDSTYEVYSITDITTLGRLMGQPAKCFVYYRFIPPDSVYLQEVGDIGNILADERSFQKMYLRLVKKKDRLYLKGRWDVTNRNDITSGYIEFRRNKKIGK
ncbi:MAG: hypothetical protein ABIU55_13615 [Ferruginibacter sp.]